jgi:hypothetical protein
MMLERVLRAAAVIIAILGLVDPVLTLPWREPTVVSVAIVDPVADEMSPLAQGALSSRDAEALKARVIAALDDEFDVREGLIADAAAVVLIGDGRSPSPTSAIASLPSAPTSPAGDAAGQVVAAVVPSPAANTARIVRIDAPKRAHISELVPVTVQVEARGLAGRTSTIVAHAAGLEVARATHKWTAGADDVEQAEINLAIPSLQTGPVRFTISVIDDSKDSTNGGSRSNGATAGVAVDVHDRPLRVLFVNGRPSWATRFIERALDSDPRFSVSTATRVSRGLTASSASAPASLATSDPDSFHAIVLGAPELLTKAEADILRTFVRVRGGLLIVAPDRMLDQSSPLIDLLPARKFTERLLNDPAELTPMFASEFAMPDALLPGAETLLRLGSGPATTPAPAAGAPVIVGSPLGEGYAIVSGALDAWRYRDRAQDGFDRFWRDTISTRAAAVPEPVEIALDPVVAAPDAPINLQVRVRSSSVANAANTTATIAARLTPTSTRAASAPVSSSALASSPPSSSASSSPPASNDTLTTTPIRLWPDARPSAYHGAINAPSRDGVYAVSVQLDGQATLSRAYFRVQHDARITRPAWPGLQAFVEARRGLLVTSDQLDRLTRHLREFVRPANTRHARHPLRSAWWILPFAACLGGEWLLRRRRGER